MDLSHWKAEPVAARWLIYFSLVTVIASLIGSFVGWSSSLCNGLFAVSLIALLVKLVVFGHSGHRR